MTAPLRTFRDDFRQTAALSPDRPALIDSGRDSVLSYGALAELLPRVEALFEARAVAAGGTVMTLLPHAVETLVCFLATVHGGYGFAPLTPESNGRELRRWVRLVKPSLCLADKSLSAELSAVLDELGVPVVAIELDGAFAWVPPPPARPSAGRGASRLYLTTSGSTGEPRALVFDGDRLWSSALAFIGHHGFLRDGDRFINMLPMSYLGGLFNLCLIPLAARGGVVVWETFTGRSFLNFWQTVERFEISVLWLVPTIVRGLLAISERTRRHEIAGRPTPVRASFLGTAPIDLATKTRFEEVFGIPLLENFALSETTFFSTETLNTRSHRREGSVGQIIPYAEVRLVPVAAEAAEGVASPTEIRVRSPYLFLGYLKEDGDIDLPLDADGFLPTNDLGHLEGELLVIDGRTRDIIKKGGYFVSLREIEVLAEQNPLVAEAIAVKVPHDFYGESCVLYLRLAEGAAEAEALAQFSPWLRSNLVRYKWPERILAVADFPRTASGKVRKHLLSETPA